MTQTEELQQQEDALRDMQKEFDYSRLEFNSLQEDLQHREDEFTHRLQAVDQREQDLAARSTEEDLANVVAERDELSQQMDGVRDELDAISQQYQEVIDQLNERQQLVQALESQLAEQPDVDASEEVNQLREQLSQERNELHEQQTRFEQDLAEARETITSLQQAATEQGESNSDVDAPGLAELRSQLETAQRDLDYRDETLEAVREEVAAERSEWLTIRAELDEKLEEAHNGDALSGEQHDQIGEVTEALNERKSEQDRAAEELDQRTSRLDDRTEELSERELQLERVQTESDTERTQLKELRRELELARAQFGTQAQTDTDNADVFSQSAEDVKNTAEGETHLVQLRSELADMFGIDEIVSKSPTVETQEPVVEEPNPFASPTAMAPVDAEPIAPVAAPATEDASYVEAYMEQLLARTRGEDAPVPASKPIAATKPQSQTKSNSDATSDTEVPVAEVEPEIRQRAPVDKELLRANIDSFRAVANQSARSAIERHAWEKNRNKLSLRAVMIAMSFIFGIVLTLLHLMGTMESANFALVFLTIGSIGCIHLLYTLRRIRESTHDLTSSGSETDRKIEAAKEEDDDNEFVLSDVDNYLAGGGDETQEQQPTED
jgi:hypothetical protein